MNKELEEILKDIKSLNNVIRNELDKEKQTSTVELPVGKGLPLAEFLESSTLSLDNKEKVKNITRKTTLSTQLQCIQSQKETLVKHL